MKQLLIALFIIFSSMNVLGQTIFREINYFREIPIEFLTNLDRMGADSTLFLNDHEGQYLNFIFKTDTTKFNLIGKRVAFVTSYSLGSKMDFFKYEQDWYSRGSVSGVGGATLYIFTAEQKEEVGGYDAAIAYWYKRIVPINDVVKKLKKQKYT
jgi:hypothetical protein